jgi:ABC-type transport system substrate-binding protein
MWTKRILILLPIAVAVFLLQSYFWVPTYEEQARATPERLAQFITASIGDAQILNPILNADTASSGICGQVFEGLIDRDEDLNWRGRLATSWDISEEAYFVVNPKDGRTAEEIVALLRSEKGTRADEKSVLGACLRNIETVEVLPAETLARTVKESPPGAEGEKEGEARERVQVTVTVERPPRVKLTLKGVDQDLFKTLVGLLGKEYFSSFEPEKYVEVEPKAFVGKSAAYARKFVPATEHNPVILFHLRRGVKFHDGHEFDSGDVKFTYEAILNPKNLSPRVSDYEPVKAVGTPDRYTVRVVYKRLFSPGFGTWGMGILPEHLLNDEVLREEAEAKEKDFTKFSMRESDFNRHPIGCGPFEFVEWESDEYIKLVRYEDYWEGPPEYREYIYRVIPDPLTQELEFYAGAVDNYSVQPHQVARLRDDERFQHFSGLSFGYSYIGYNMRLPKFQDRRVRRALGMAIDVDRIIEHILYDQAERITGPFVKQTDFYDDEIEPLPHDPEGALRLLAEAGWKRNADGWLEKGGEVFRFKLITNNGNAIRKAVMTIAQDSWKKLGIDCRTDLLEWSVFIGKYIDKGDFDACVLGWSMGIEPDLYQIWHSSQSGENELNFCAYENEEADDLILRIRREYNHDEQVRDCHRLHRIIAEDQPYTFLFVRKWTAVLDRRIIRVIRDDRGEILGYRKIVPTKTGSYTYHFNQWRKLPQVPELLPEDR